MNMFVSPSAAGPPQEAAAGHGNKNSCVAFWQIFLFPLRNQESISYGRPHPVSLSGPLQSSSQKHSFISLHFVLLAISIEPNVLVEPGCWVWPLFSTFLSHVAQIVIWRRGGGKGNDLPNELQLHLICITRIGLPQHCTGPVLCRCPDNLLGEARRRCCSREQILLCGRGHKKCLLVVALAVRTAWIVVICKRPNGTHFPQYRVSTHGLFFASPG